MHLAAPADIAIVYFGNVRQALFAKFDGCYFGIEDVWPNVERLHDSRVTERLAFNVRHALGGGNERTTVRQLAAVVNVTSEGGPFDESLGEKTAATASLEKRNRFWTKSHDVFDCNDFTGLVYVPVSRARRSQRSNPFFKKNSLRQQRSLVSFAIFQKHAKVSTCATVFMNSALDERFLDALPAAVAKLRLSIRTLQFAFVLVGGGERLDAPVHVLLAVCGADDVKWLNARRQQDVDDNWRRAASANNIAINAAVDVDNDDDDNNDNNNPIAHDQLPFSVDANIGVGDANDRAQAARAEAADGIGQPLETGCFAQQVWRAAFIVDAPRNDISFFCPSIFQSVKWQNNCSVDCSRFVSASVENYRVRKFVIPFGMFFVSLHFFQDSLWSFATSDAPRSAATRLRKGRIPRADAQHRLVARADAHARRHNGSRRRMCARLATWQPDQYSRFVLFCFFFFFQFKTKKFNESFSCLFFFFFRIH
jgi:hypothetical protein